MDKQNVVTWLGRPIEDLTREELIEAMRYCASEIKSLHEALGDWHRLARLTRKPAEVSPGG